MNCSNASASTTSAPMRCSARWELRGASPKPPPTTRADDSSPSCGGSRSQLPHKYQSTSVEPANCQPRTNLLLAICLPPHLLKEAFSSLMVISCQKSHRDLVIIRRRKKSLLAEEHASRTSVSLWCPSTRERSSSRSRARFALGGVTPIRWTGIRASRW